MGFSDAEPAAKPVRPTVMRLGLRQVVSLMLLAAFVGSVVTPRIQAWQEPQRKRFTYEAASALVPAAGLAALLCWRRRRVELQAGEERLRVRSELGQKPWGGHVAYLGFSSPMLAICVGPIWSQAPFDPARLWGPMIMMALCGLGLSFCTLLYWWRMLPPTLELCERGVIYCGLSFLPWERIERWFWNGKGRRSFTLIAGQNEWTISVAPQLTQQVDRLLTDALPRNREEPLPTPTN